MGKPGGGRSSAAAIVALKKQKETIRFLEDRERYRLSRCIAHCQGQFSAGCNLKTRRHPEISKVLPILQETTLGGRIEPQKIQLHSIHILSMMWLKG